MPETTVLCVSVLSGEDLLSGPDWIKVENSKTLIDVLVQVSGTRALGQQVQVVVSREPSFTEAALVQVLNPVSLLDDSRSIYVKFLLRSSVLSLKQSVDLKCKAERDTDIPPLHFLQRDESTDRFGSELETNSKLNLPFESSYLNKIYMEQKVYQATVTSRKQEIGNKLSPSCSSQKFTTWQQQCEIKSHIEEESKNETLVSLSLDGLTKWTQPSSPVSLASSEVDFVGGTAVGTIGGSVKESPEKADTAQNSLANSAGHSSEDPLGSTSVKFDGGSLAISAKKCDNGDTSQIMTGIKSSVSSQNDVAINGEGKIANGSAAKLVTEEEQQSTSRSTKPDSNEQKCQQTGKCSPANVQASVSNPIVKSRSVSQAKKPIARPKLSTKTSSCVEKKDHKLGMPSLRTKPLNKRETVTLDKAKKGNVNTAGTAEKSGSKSSATPKSVNETKRPNCSGKSQAKSLYTQEKSSLFSSSQEKGSPSCSASTRNNKPTRVVTKRPGVLVSAKRTVSPCFSVSRTSKIAGRNKVAASEIGAKANAVKKANTKGSILETEKIVDNAKGSEDNKLSTGKDSVTSKVAKENVIGGEVQFVETGEEIDLPPLLGQDCVQPVLKDCSTVDKKQQNHEYKSEVSSAGNYAAKPAITTPAKTMQGDSTASEFNASLHTTQGNDAAENDFSKFLETFAKDNRAFEIKEFANNFPLPGESSATETSRVFSSEANTTLKTNELEMDIREKDVMTSSSPTKIQDENCRVDKSLTLFDSEMLLADFKASKVVKRSPGSRIALFCEDATQSRTGLVGILSTSETEILGALSQADSCVDSLELNYGIQNDNELQGYHSIPQRKQSVPQSNNDTPKGMPNGKHSLTQSDQSISEGNHSSPQGNQRIPPGSQSSLLFHSLIDKSLMGGPKDVHNYVEKAAASTSVKRTQSLNEAYLDSTSKKSGFFDHLKERTIESIQCGIEKEGGTEKARQPHDNQASDKALLNVTMDKEDLDNKTPGLTVREDHYLATPGDSVVFLGEIGRNAKANRTFTVDESDYETPVSSSHTEPENNCKETGADGSQSSDYSYNLNENVICHVRKKWDLKTGIIDQLLLSSLLDLSMNLTDIATRIIGNTRKEISKDNGIPHKDINTKRKIDTSNESAEVFKNLRKLEKQLLEIEDRL